MKEIEVYLGGKKYLAGDRLTYVDFMLYELIELTDLTWNHTLLDEFPTLATYHSTIDKIPQLRAYR